jgi:type II secretory pathway pseudopilin PulG
VLVVLAILGLAAAAVGPRLAGMIDSIAFAMARETFEQDLGGLPYQAFTSGADLVLGGGAGQPAIPSARPPSGPEPATAAQAAVVQLPAGWRLDVAQPIWFRASGYCSGGTVVVTAGEISETYLLRPPLCRPEPQP